ncbi:progesterone-induced-blocking factor 1-like isoform X1 [Portunus trituberculatus]|uniref:progesterone-induced-blocking factor 1-like isoform X1 n=2 Tax=Portunus trituberculatus TaxID=210409 RepID=UPI001E1D1A3D|nr:progesterone-induced-blocking factor 1-like isoform X1 [Portunus trituberculatus]
MTHAESSEAQAMSGEGSADASVPTDLTVTSHGDSEEEYAATRRHARELQSLASERAELHRTVEKLKLEVQNKDAQLTALRHQLQASVAKAVAQRDDQLSNKQIQVTSLEMELKRTKEELSTLRERAARELAHLTQKCSQFQQNQKRLVIRQDELRKSLADLQLSQEEFTTLRQTSPEELSLQQYTALRVYELVWPLRLRLNELEAVKSSLESAVDSKDSDLRSRREECSKLRRSLEEVQRKCEQYASQLVSLKDEQRNDDFKVRNYSRVKAERDQLQEEKVLLTKTNNEFELINATLKKEHSLLQEHFSELKRKQRTQKFDLSHYQEQSIDLKTKLDRVSEELASVSKQLAQERERCGDLHEKYLSARGDAMQLTENNRDQQHEMKLLRERLEACKLQCSGMQDKVTFLSQQNENLNTDVERSRLKLTIDTQSLNAQLQDLRVSLSAVTKNRDTVLEENSRLHHRIQELDDLCQKEKTQRGEETTALSKELQRVRNTLSAFEGLPEEYEKAVKAAAALPAEETSKVLDRILPASRLQGDWAVEQCIQLTRKVLQLEGESLEAYNTIQQLTEALDHLKNTVSSYKTALGLAGQPSASLLERIASQEDQITSIHAALDQHTAIKTRLVEENKTLSRQVAQLSQRLEEAGIEAGELSAIKKKLESLLQDSPHQGLMGTGSPRKDTDRTEEKGPPQTFPPAIIITKKSRYQSH